VVQTFAKKVAILTVPPPPHAHIYGQRNFIVISCEGFLAQRRICNNVNFLHSTPCNYKVKELCRSVFNYILSHIFNLEHPSIYRYIYHTSSAFSAYILDLGQNMLWLNSG